MATFLRLGIPTGHVDDMDAHEHLDVHHHHIILPGKNWLPFLLVRLLECQTYAIARITRTHTGDRRTGRKLISAYRAIFFLGGGVLYTLVHCGTGFGSTEHY